MHVGIVPIAPEHQNNQYAAYANQCGAYLVINFLKEGKIMAEATLKDESTTQQATPNKRKQGKA